MTHRDTHYPALQTTTTSLTTDLSDFALRTWFYDWRGQRARQSGPGTRGKRPARAAGIVRGTFTFDQAPGYGICRARVGHRVVHRPHPWQRSSSSRATPSNTAMAW
jgi:hypothetical protein